MSNLDDLTVVVVGLGAMGRGIARVFAAAGAEVRVLDVDAQRTTDGHAATVEEAAEDPGAGARITAVPELADALDGAHLLVEAIVEDLGSKRDLLHRVADHAAPELIVASNTSSLSVGAMGAAYGDPGRVLGLHFFNPPIRMQLVEVVVAAGTDPQVVDTAVDWITACGKTPVRCQDSPNFVVNRVCRPLYYEAQLLAAAGHEPAVVDVVARRALGHRVGPLELLDHVGIHTHVASSETAHRELTDPRYRPIPLARRLVAAGHTGKAAGHGFYDHGLEPPREARSRVLEPPPAGDRPVVLAGPDADRIAEVAALPAAAGGTAHGGVTLYACGPRVGDADVIAVRDAAASGAVVVESSDGRWLDDLPAGVGWVRLHAAADRPFAEVVADDTAAVSVTDGVQAVLAAAGADAVRVLASPGLVADRLRSCLINEAVTLDEEGLAEPHDIDVALRLGMNHPQGPFEALADAGTDRVRATLAGLARDLGDPRYRPALRLVRLAAGAART